MAKAPVLFHEKLGKGKHEHPLQPIEFGHPTTVTDADIPAGLTTENVAVIQMGGSRFSSLVGNDFPLSNWTDAAQVVKERYGDCFDFIIFFTDPNLPAIPYSGYHRRVYNEVNGINRSSFNSRPTWDSERLQSQIWMGRFSLGTLLQEVGHRWGSFVRYRLTPTAALQSDLMLSGGGHWAREFDDDNSPMDYDEERHTPWIFPNQWLRSPIGGFEFKYCPLDLYLMGLLAPAEVGRFTLIRNYTEIGPPLPGGRQVVSGIPRYLRARNIRWAEGNRVPNRNNSQKNFRAAFVVVTRNSNRLDNNFVKKVEVLRQQLEQYYPVATHKRACMDTRLCCGNTVSRKGEITMKLKQNKITWSPSIYHGLGPVPVKVELGLETSIGGNPIDSWSREETPDIATGIQNLSAQVNRDPYDGTFKVVAQVKGFDRTVIVNWWASTIS